jgi:hypothetical protein
MRNGLVEINKQLELLNSLVIVEYLEQNLLEQNLKASKLKVEVLLLQIIREESL